MTTREDQQGGESACACPMDDGYNCAAFRAGRSVPVMAPGEDDERCECVCHEEHEGDCDSEDPDDFDRNACPGCGGSCQRACA